MHYTRVHKTVMCSESHVSGCATKNTLTAVSHIQTEKVLKIYLQCTTTRSERPNAMIQYNLEAEKRQKSQIIGCDFVLWL